MDEHKPNHNMLPLLIGGGALLFFVASRGGGAQVIGQPAASDIIAANENANNNYTQVLLARIKTAGDYYSAKTAADQAIKVAQVNGASAAELQALANQANIAIANINSTRDTTIAQDALQATVNTNDSNQLIAKLNAQSAQAIAVTEAGVQKDISNNDATIAQRQASAQKTTSIVSTIGNIISGALHFFSPTPSTVNMNGVASTGDLVATIPTPTP